MLLISSGTTAKNSKTFFRFVNQSVSLAFFQKRTSQAQYFSVPSQMAFALPYMIIKYFTVGS